MYYFLKFVSSPLLNISSNIHPFMPLLSQTYAAFAGVIVVIILGIVIERKKVGWENVFGNVLSFIILLSTIDMKLILFLGLLGYLLLGIVIAYYKVSVAYPLFGFKTYGALSLVLLLASLGYWGLSLTAETSYNFFRLLVSWFIVAIIVHIICYIFHKK